jgi:hypothetical protein
MPANRFVDTRMAVKEIGAMGGNSSATLLPDGSAPLPSGRGAEIIPIVIKRGVEA